MEQYFKNLDITIATQEQIIAALAIIGYILIAAFVIGAFINAFLFKKMGIKPWKAFIPFYSTFTEIKFLTGSKKLAWMYFASIPLVFIPIIQWFAIGVIVGLSTMLSYLLVKGFGKNFWHLIWVNTPLAIFILLAFAFSKKYQFNEEKLDREFFNF